jgi:hypothetical protein
MPLPHRSLRLDSYLQTVLADVSDRPASFEARLSSPMFESPELPQVRSFCGAAGINDVGPSLVSTPIVRLKPPHKASQEIRIMPSAGFGALVALAKSLQLVRSTRHYTRLHTQSISNRAGYTRVGTANIAFRLDAMRTSLIGRSAGVWFR